MNYDPAWLRQHNAMNMLHPLSRPAELLTAPPDIIVRGDGCHIWDSNGHKLLDGVGGLWSSNLGHSNKPVRDAMVEQLDQLPFYNIFNGVTHDKAIALSATLAELMTPEAVSHVFFSNGGSDAVETALKFARQFYKLQGYANRTKFISLRQGYHGVHFGGMSINGNPIFRVQYEPLLQGCSLIDPPWLSLASCNNEEEQGRLAAELLEREILAQGPDTVAAFIAEPVQGAGGVYVPPDNFWRLARQVCDRHGVLLIADEVVTGFGRTGEMFGTRLWGVHADMWCFAKGITSGYAALGVTAIGKRVADVFVENNAHIAHGYTYSAHPVAAAAAIATLDQISALGVLENVRNVGGGLQKKLRLLEQQCDALVQVRGIGLMAALQFKDSGDLKAAVWAEQVRRAAYKRGLMVRASGPNVILSPPLIICEDLITNLCERLHASIGEVQASR